MEIPTKITLKKYGLDEKDWVRMYNKYGGRCHCCLCIPPSGKYYIDHEHLSGYKKLSDRERKSAVRGLLCFHCNRRLLQRGNDNLRKIRNAVSYLERYESGLKIF